MFLLPNLLESAGAASLVSPGLKGMNALHRLLYSPSLSLWLLSSAFLVYVF